MKVNLVAMVTMLAVGVILIGSLLVPVINDSSKTFTDPYSNGSEASTVSFATYSTKADFDITMTKLESGWSYTGIDTNTLASGAYIISDNIIVILSPSNGFAVYGINDSLAYVAIGSSNWNGVSYTVNSVLFDVTPTAIIVSDGDGVQPSYTFPNTYVIYTDNEGDRLICTSTKEVYTNGGKDIISAGQNNNKFFWSTNGSDSKVVYNATLLDSSIECPLTEVTKDVDKIKVGSSGDYKVSFTSGGTDYSLAPKYVSVPKTVYQETPAGSAIQPILNVIPIIVIVALLMAAVTIVVRGRQ